MERERERGPAPRTCSFRKLSSGSGTLHNYIGVRIAGRRDSSPKTYTFLEINRNRDVAGLGESGPDL